MLAQANFLLSSVRSSKDESSFGDAAKEMPASIGLKVNPAVSVCTWGQFAGRGRDAGALSSVRQPRCDPLRVWGGEQLLGRLTELQYLGQHGDSLVRVLDASQRGEEENMRRTVQRSLPGMMTAEGIRFLPVAVDAALIRQWVEHWKTRR